MKFDKKVVVWGIGIRGKDFIEYIGQENVEAIIDNNLAFSVLEAYDSIPIVSFETYLKKYQKYFIVVTPLAYQDIETQLKAHKIYQYFILVRNPSELQGYGIKSIFEYLPICYDVNACNVVYGLDLFGVLLYEFLVRKGCHYVYLLPHRGADSNTILACKQIYNHHRFIERIEQTGFDSGRIFVTVPERLIHNGSWIEENCFDFSDRIMGYKNTEIEKFKNAESGKRGFIVCTGPSLRIEDLNTLKAHNEICISVNKIFLAFSKTNWRPQYYIAWDRKILRECKEFISQLDVPNKFCPDTETDILEKKDDIYIFHNHVYSPDTSEIAFSDNVAIKVYMGYTVAYAALQLACYLGFESIYLLGVDFSYTSNPNDVANHFVKEYVSKTNQVNPFSMKECLIGYQKAKEYACSHGIKIYNATRGGNLEVFERVDFDELFL